MEARTALRVSAQRSTFFAQSLHMAFAIWSRKKMGKHFQRGMLRHLMLACYIFFLLSVAIGQCVSVSSFCGVVLAMYFLLKWKAVCFLGVCVCVRWGGLEYLVSWIVLTTLRLIFKVCPLVRALWLAHRHLHFWIRGASQSFALSRGVALWQSIKETISQ